MPEKSNTATVIVIVVVAVLAIPCLLGTLAVGGVLLWKESAPMKPMQAPMEPQEKIPVLEKAE